MTTTPTSDDMAVSEPRAERATAPRLVTVMGAARLLGVGRTTIYELVARGELEVVHIGRAARIPISSIDRFVDGLRRR